MRKRAVLATGVCTLLLSACGGSQEEPPVEQIVVREPGEPDTASPADANAGLLAAGTQAFARCVACHTVEPGGPHGIGPNLHGIVGQPAASRDGYNYSSALAAADIVWNEAELDAYIANSTQYVPGTTMALAPLDDADRRAAIISYLVAASE